MIKGLDLARAYYEKFGEPMLKEQFPDLLPYLAAGLCGSGSECFGYDDEISKDHDFEPGFCLFLPGEDLVDRKTAFKLERAYAKLPKEFMGYRRSLVQPAGGARHGVIRLGDFFLEKTGSPDGKLDFRQWLRVPGQGLAEAVNGEIYFDQYGEMTRIRQEISFYPEDIRRKKLAGNLLLMAQSGQYNYQRCLGHGETAAAQLAVYEFATSAMEVLFLLNRCYRPYYKWSFRALRALPVQSYQAELLEFLLTSDNDGEMAEEKWKVMEGICGDIIEELAGQELTSASCGDLEKHAYSVNDTIKESGLRNMHILSAV
ncbi:MAG: DUF4037 domain-containing protein [Eubacterium sp.]|nr:DUF4037 domain-containing protein [Eubacterium sp.]